VVVNPSSIPNFLMIGAAKSGTTSLWNYLRQHPQIFLASVKEPRFFAYEGETVNYSGPGDDKWGREIINSWDAYQALFQSAKGQLALGEASNVYLYFAQRAAPRIASRLPGVKLIAILRNPVDRAYSNFLMMRGEGREPLSDFRRALREEEKRLRNGWSPGWAYYRRGLYADSLRTYLAYFPRERMRFLLYDDLVQAPGRLLQEIFEFLGVDPFLPDLSQRHNVSVHPRSHLLAFLIHNRTPLSRSLRKILPETIRLSINQALRAANATRPPVLQSEIRREISASFREDIRQVSQLIDRDLSGWLSSAE
jgi:hypothetical protein